MADEIKNLPLSITVDDGFQRIPITNKYGDEIGVFYFNPTDIGIIERYNSLADYSSGNIRCTGKSHNHLFGAGGASSVPAQKVLRIR